MENYRVLELVGEGSFGKVCTVAACAPTARSARSGSAGDLAPHHDRCNAVMLCTQDCARGSAQRAAVRLTSSPSVGSCQSKLSHNYQQHANKARAKA